MSKKDCDVGYGKPPVSTRFQKEQSGNPRGRPQGSSNGIPYDTVLGQMVTIREDGQVKRVTAAEAFLMKLTRQGLEGDGAATRQMLAAIEQARSTEIIDDGRPRIDKIVIVPVSPNVNPALEPLRMGRKLDRFRPSARMVLEPWIVEAALARLGGRKLSRDEQRAVFAATRTPHKVTWPEWWSEGLESSIGVLGDK